MTDANVNAETSSVGSGELVSRKSHEIKCWPEYFEKIADGTKTFECREDNRTYGVGDELNIREWEPLRQDPHCEVHHYHMGDGHCTCYEKGSYTGKQVVRYVTYIMKVGRLGLREGYVCMALSANQ